MSPILASAFSGFRPPMEPVPSYVAAAGALLVFTFALHALMVREVTTPVAAAGMPTRRMRGVKSFVIGADARASTSKVQVVMWTYAIAFVFLALIFQDRTEPITQGVSTQYLYLLGIPVAGAAGASLITGTKKANGEVDKGVADPPSPGVTEGLAELVSDDNGRGDLGDFQYLLFNLVALTFFFAKLFRHAPDDLPVIPDTLVALTGTSALAYLLKKGVVKDLPVVSAVYPSKALPGEQIHVRGANFIGPSSPPADEDPSRGIRVLICGRVGGDLDTSRPTELAVTVPTDAPVGKGDIRVATSWTESEPAEFEVLAPPAP
jgi:hypothetical protein